MQVMAAAQSPQVKNVAAAPIQSVDGKDTFHAYCSVCHGDDAKGTGPAAAAMKTRPADLTTIVKRKGKFSPADVERVIKGSDKTRGPEHGTTAMPIWGDVFRNEDAGRQTLRFNNLVSYIQSIQVGG